MFTKPDHSAIRAMVRLSQDEFGPFRDYLTGEIRHLERLIASVDSRMNIYRIQGRLLSVRGLLELVEAAGKRGE